MMVNFMCELGPRVPRFLVKRYFVVSVSVFLDEINM